MSDKMKKQHILLTGQEAARFLGISYGAFKPLVDAGRIMPAPTIGIAKRYTRYELVRFSFGRKTADELLRGEK
jgi:DNA-directed RNA polymerase subunit K/omega